MIYKSSRFPRSGKEYEQQANKNTYLLIDKMTKIVIEEERKAKEIVSRTQQHEAPKVLTKKSRSIYHSVQADWLDLH